MMVPPTMNCDNAQFSLNVFLANGVVAQLAYTGALPPYVFLCSLVSATSESRRLTLPYPVGP